MLGGYVTHCKTRAQLGIPGILAGGGPHAKLAADILSAYIDGQMPASIPFRIALAIQQHSTHERIVSSVKEKVLAFIGSNRRLPMPNELQDIGRTAIDNFRMPPPSAFGPDAPLVKPYFSGELQQIVSGIHSIGLVNMRYEAVVPDIAIIGSYRVTDAYDFDNDRSMFPFYDTYRKELAGLCKIGDTTFAGTSPFFLRYEGDLVKAVFARNADAVNGPLSGPLIYTCFMYALEKNDITKSLPWAAEVGFGFQIVAADLAVLATTDRPGARAGETSVDTDQHRQLLRKLPDLKPRTPPPRIRTRLPPPPAPKETLHVVRRGDTLSALAKIYYRDASKWPRIYTANQAVIGPDPNLILPGARLRIPLSG